MDTTKTQHINKLVQQDDIKCLQNIKDVQDSDYAEDAKNLIIGFFRQRSDMDQQILFDNGFYGEKNINVKTEESC